MQAWNVVKVIEADGNSELAGKVGIVTRAHDDKQLAVVKLDDVSEPVTFAYAELQVLA